MRYIYFTSLSIFFISLFFIITKSFIDFFNLNNIKQKLHAKILRNLFRYENYYALARLNKKYNNVLIILKTSINFCNLEDTIGLNLLEQQIQLTQQQKLY